MANEIQVSTSFPTLREINKSLKVVDKLLLSSNKLRWNDLDVSMQCYIFHQLFCIEKNVSDWDYFTKGNGLRSLDQFFLDFLSDRERFLDRYIDASSKYGLYVETTPLLYGEFCVFTRQDLINAYCKEFNAEIHIISSNEHKVKYFWKEIIIDYSLFRSRGFSKIKGIRFSLYNERFSSRNNLFSIRHKNIHFLKEMDEIYLLFFNGIEHLKYNAVKTIFDAFNADNITYLGLCRERGKVSQRDLNMISDCFPKIETLEVGPPPGFFDKSEVIQDYSFLGKLNYLEEFIYTFRFEYSSMEELDYNVPYENLTNNIAQLKNLKVLELFPIVYKKDEFDYHCNVIKDVSFLSNLNHLEMLQLTNCREDINLDLFFDGVVKLEELYIRSYGCSEHEQQVKAIKSKYEEGREFEFPLLLSEQIEKLREYRPELKIELEG